MMRRTLFGTIGVLATTLAHSAALAQPAPEPVPAPPAEPTVAPPPPPATPPPVATPAPAAATPPPPPMTASSDSTSAPDAKEEKPASPASAYVIPDAPAFTILDVTPATIDRPATLTKLGASLANVVTDKGVVRSGVALEVSLRGLGVFDRSSHHEYVTRFLTRLLARTAFSLATVSDSSTAKTPAQTRLGFGLRLVLVDNSDPLLDAAYVADVEKVGRECKASAGGDPAKEAMCEANTYSAMANKPVVRWNYGGLALGAAQSLAFEEARLKDGEADRFGAWVAGAFGVGTCFQQAFGAKYVRSFPTDGHSLTASERTRIGNERFRGSLEVSYTFNEPKDQDVPLAQAALGAELKVSDALWLTANLGGSINDASDVAGLFALSNVKWNFDTTPSWGDGAK